MKKKTNEPTKKYWARQCDVTGQGMLEGYCWGDGSFYCINDDKIALAEFRKEREYIISLIPENVEEIKEYENYREEDNFELAIARVRMNKETDEDLRSLSYLFDLHYYTEWFEEEDIMYVEIDGVLEEIE